MALSLGACGGNDPVADNGAGAALPDVESAPPDEMTGAGDSENAATPVGEQAAATIPPALHGRWALGPDDCNEQSGAAKGLLIISADGLRFFESRAKPVGNVEAGSDFISADFAFEGEGQSWKRFESLEIRGETLVRTESTPMETYTYARCE